MFKVVVSSAHKIKIGVLKLFVWDSLHCRHKYTNSTNMFCTVYILILIWLFFISVEIWFFFFYSSNLLSRTHLSHPCKQTGQDKSLYSNSKLAFKHGSCVVQLPPWYSSKQFVVFLARTSMTIVHHLTTPDTE